MRNVFAALRRIVVAVALLALGANVARAQGNLSTQGLGYPPGQMSTASTSMGGSIAEVDPLSALNPAAIGFFPNALIVLQAEPEFRALRIGSQTLRTSVARFPLFLGSMPLGSRWAVSVSASTLLDRTWETTVRDSQFVSNDTIAGSIGRKSDGSIADMRLALSFAPATWLRIGVGGHAYSGRDFLRVVRVFDDSARFLSDTQSTTLGYGGNALSVGFQGLWPRVGSVGVSYRRGGTLRNYVGDSLVKSGTVPDHFGASFAYLGVNGATFAVRAARDKWANLEKLASNMTVHEGWDIGVGADVTGPKYGAGALALRAGVRWRTLPFSATTSPVKEQTWSGGFGIPMAGGRVDLNLGALRAQRTSPGIASESAWTISTGFAVRP